MKLIFSKGQYDWLRYTAGKILESEPKQFDVMILNQDDSPILNHPGLCSEAILAQRRYDLLQIGHKLKIRKLMYIDPGDLERFIAQLQLYIIMSSTKEIYYHKDIEWLEVLLVNIKKYIPIRLFSYGFDGSIYHPKTHWLACTNSEDAGIKKTELDKFMIGISNNEQIPSPYLGEVFEEVESNE